MIMDLTEKKRRCVDAEYIIQGFNHNLNSVEQFIYMKYLTLKAHNKYYHMKISFSILVELLTIYGKKEFPKEALFAAGVLNVDPGPTAGNAISFENAPLVVFYDADCLKILLVTYSKNYEL